jgi:cell division protein FtsI/penicillin-binding protein 2
MYTTRHTLNRVTFLLIGAVVFTAILIIRLFYLQVVMHDYYKNVAAKEHYGYVELPARRGEIIITDYHSNEEFPIATNVTLDLLYADPALVEYPEKITENFAQLIYNKDTARENDNARIAEAANRGASVPEPTPTSSGLSNPEPSSPQPTATPSPLAPKTDDELFAEFKTDLNTKISSKLRPEILLATDLDQDTINEINSFKVNGIEVKNKNLYAYPPQITSLQAAANHLAPILETPTKKLETILAGKNRYVVLARKLDPDISTKIKDMIAKDKEGIFNGIGMQEEYFRYYPEGQLAANAVGYVDQEGYGTYGIENAFNTELQGKKGALQTQKDSIGRQVIAGDSVIEPAVDGADVVLTIDRSIQMYAEKILGQDLNEFRADSGQVMIMDPNTGYVIALASAPTFNPNEYSKVYKKVYINLTPEDIANLVPTKTEHLYYFYRNKDINDFYYIFEETNEDGQTEYYRYENYVGPEAYQNKPVSLPYEPGSVFKPLVMSAAIDDKDLTPNSTYNDSGPIGVDWNKHKGDFDFYIHNSLDNYYGPGTTMTTVLEKSLNTGMTFVSKTIGPALMYNYLKKYGFGERTDIEFANESAGYMEYYDLWTESELATHAFGQGITVTLAQLTNAFCALANGGILFQPHIVKEIRNDDGTVTTTEPTEIRRVISEETSSKLTAMLVSVVENGLEKKSKVADHYVAGKTGTAQTYKHGVAIKGVGTTIGSFCGYAPIDKPKFVMCVKYDHPRSNEWGGNTAAVTFTNIAEYLFDYYNIPPDKK